MAKYELAEIHVEIIKSLMKNEGKLIFIKDVDVLKNTESLKNYLKFETFSDENAVVKYVKEKKVPLKEIDETDNNGNTDVRIRNSIAVRDLINSENSWRLSLFVKDYFSLLIISGLEQWKFNKDFWSLYHNMILEGSSNYLTYDEYIADCIEATKAQCAIVSDKLKIVNLDEEAFVYASHVFGLSKLFIDQFQSYYGYLYDSLCRKFQLIQEGIQLFQ